MFKKQSIGLPVVGTGVAALLLTSAVQAGYGLNMTRRVTPISQEIYSLHMLIFGICIVIGVAVFSVMAWSIIHHRKSRGALAANFHESTTVEIAWTVVPLLILIAIAVPATGTLLDLEDARVEAAAAAVPSVADQEWSLRDLPVNGAAASRDSNSAAGTAFEYR